MNTEQLFLMYFRAANQEHACFHQQFTIVKTSMPEPISLAVDRHLRIGAKEMLGQSLHELELYKDEAIEHTVLIDERIEHILFGVTSDHERLFSRGIPPRPTVPIFGHRPQRLLDILDPHRASLMNVAYLLSSRRRYVVCLSYLTGEKHRLWQLSLAVIRAPKEGFARLFLRTSRRR